MKVNSDETATGLNGSLSDPPSRDVELRRPRKGFRPVKLHGDKEPAVTQNMPVILDNAIENEDISGYDATEQDNGSGDVDIQQVTRMSEMSKQDFERGPGDCNTEAATAET